MPEKVREEVTPFFTSKLSIAIADNDSERIEKLGEETVEMISSDLEVSLYTCQCQSHMRNSANTYVVLISVDPLRLAAKVERHGCKPTCKQCQIHWMDS